MVIAVVVSLGLAALILTVGSPPVAAGVAVAMLAFTATALTCKNTGPDSSWAGTGCSPGLI